MSTAKSILQLKKDEPLEYVGAEIISLKNHPHFNENWLHEVIMKDPKILGLGDLTFRSHEKRQPRAGRLDLLMEDTELQKRYEIEIQLGATDESHLIRTIEYWDNERKRYPQYEHCAVIIAEDVTNRFLNVISLFNGHIPIIAIQVKAIKIENKISLFFTKVLNEVELSLVDEDTQEPETDRNYWESKASSDNVKLTDTLLGYVQTFAQGFQLKYNKHYIGLVLNNRAQNFAAFKPQKGNIKIELRCKLPKELSAKIEKEGIAVYDYNAHWKCHPISISPEQIKTRKDIIIEVLKFAYDEYYS